MYLSAIDNLIYLLLEAQAYLKQFQLKKIPTIIETNCMIDPKGWSLSPLLTILYLSVKKKKKEEAVKWHFQLLTYTYNKK